MINTAFFTKKRNSITLEEVLALTKAKIYGDKGKVSDKISDIATLAEATSGDASFFTNAKYMEDFKNSSAGFCFTTEKVAEKAPSSMIVLVHPNPYFAYTLVVRSLYEVPIFKNHGRGISKDALVHKSARIGKNVEVLPGAYIGENVFIGDNCKICANVVIEHNCIIGENSYIGAGATIAYAEIGNHAIIHQGARIGQCGFGFAPDPSTGTNLKIPQLGIVKIGDHVEIGANTCIDRGALENTKIGNHTKIDNLVQVAHGAQIGQGTFIAGCAAIAGSAKIGNYTLIGGNASIAGHISIGSMVQVAGNSGVMKNIEDRSIIGGSPSMPIRQWHKVNTMLMKMSSPKKK